MFTHAAGSVWNKFWNEQEADLDGSSPADDESSIVFPAQAAGVHVGPQTHVIPQHIGDPLLGAEVIDFYSLEKKFPT